MRRLHRRGHRPPAPSPASYPQASRPTPAESSPPQRGQQLVLGALPALQRSSRLGGVAGNDMETLPGSYLAQRGWAKEAANS